MCHHHFLVGLCVEIITVIVVLYFLAKVKKEELGKGFKWAGRILLILGFVAIAATICGGIMGMMHCGRCGQQNECPMMDRGHCGMHDGNCAMHDGNCAMHDGNCCMHEGMMKDGKNCKMDSASGKKCPMCKDHDMGKDKMHNDSVKGIK